MRKGLYQKNQCFRERRLMNIPGFIQAQWGIKLALEDQTEQGTTGVRGIDKRKTDRYLVRINPAKRSPNSSSSTF